MSKRTEKDFLSDMREAVKRIISYIENMTYEEFLKDIKTQDAVVRNLEIMGEATKNLSEGLRDKYSDIPWRGMAGVRDRLIHDYFGVNLDIVWNIVKEELPGVLIRIEEIIQNE